MSRRLTGFSTKASSGYLSSLSENHCGGDEVFCLTFLSRVDQPDVDLDEDDAPAVEEETEEEAMETNEQEPNKKQFKLSYEKYKKISFLIIEHIRFVF